MTKWYERNLPAKARMLLAAAHARRVANELAHISAIARSSGGRLRLGDLVARDTAGGRFSDFSLHLTVATAASARPGEPPASLPTVAQVEALFAIDRYPEGPAAVRLLSDLPLFLPAVFSLSQPIEGRWPAFVCTHRGAFEPARHDLPFLVGQVHRALTCDPAVLNALHDALNPIAARWLLARRERLTLPFEPELVPRSPSATPPGRGFSLQPAP
jgi:hypothetical protein